MNREYSGECLSAFGAGYNIGYRQAHRCLQSLIERDKPKKPEQIENLKGFGKCQCGKNVYEQMYNFCPGCGQRLDWSE